MEVNMDSLARARALRLSLRGAPFGVLDCLPSASQQDDVIYCLLPMGRDVGFGIMAGGARFLFLLAFPNKALMLSGRDNNGIKSTGHR